MRQAGEVNYTNTHQVQPQHELLSGAIITINVLLRVGVERELLSLGRAATWSKFYLSAKSNTHQLEAFACTTNFRYALDKLDGAELGGRRIRIFEEGKGGGGGGGGGRGRSRSRSRSRSSPRRARRSRTRSRSRSKSRDRSRRSGDKDRSRSRSRSGARRSRSRSRS